MSAAPREAKGHDSRKALALPVGFGAFNAARIALAVAAVAGVICLIVATFSTVIEITVGTTSQIANRDTHLTGLDRHSVALTALAVAGIVVLLIALIGDLPDVHKTGVIGQLYDNARANPKIGYYLETLGGALLLVAGGGLLLLGAPPEPAPPARRSVEG